jgi:hypothetical protein
LIIEDKGFYTSDMRNGIEVQLNLGCNTFKTGGAISNYQSRNGIKLNSGASVADIGGDGENANGNLHPNPAGNVWPEGNGRHGTSIAGWNSPSNWTSIYKSSGTPIIYNRYKNEFVENSFSNYIQNPATFDAITSEFDRRLQTDVVICENVSFPPNSFPGRVASKQTVTDISDIKLPISLYPNPTTGEIKFHGLSENKTYIAKTISSSGLIVESSAMYNKSNLDLSSLPVGFYKVILIDAETGVQQSFSIIRSEK